MRKRLAAPQAALVGIGGARLVPTNASAIDHPVAATHGILHHCRVSMRG
jgi:hypothetical protein